MSDTTPLELSVFAFCFMEFWDDTIPGGGPVCTCLVFQ